MTEGRKGAHERVFRDEEGNVVYREYYNDAGELVMIEEALNLSVDRVTTALTTQVDTDGRTVWVNAPMCIGRFCPVSGEVMLPDGHVEGTPPEWAAWCALMELRHNFVVDNKYRPEWSK